MKHLILLIVSLLAFTSCINENGWYGEGIDKENNDTKSEENQPASKANKDETPKEIISFLLKSSVSITNMKGGKILNTGSGAFISSNLVVTNYHVIEGGETVELIRNSDKKKFFGKIKRYDKFHDVCIIKLTNERVENFLSINQDKAKIGEEITVVGSPIGLDGTISKGIISNIQKKEPYDYKLLQISAPISPGSSGGPVVNIKGELLGISVGSSQGDGVQNINFAVPARYISFLLDE